MCPSVLIPCSLWLLLVPLLVLEALHRGRVVPVRMLGTVRIGEDEWLVPLRDAVLGIHIVRLAGRAVLQ